ncbi:hypothetical protein BLNAU_18002 [Blattamonas nauphoetae]|uniref:Uncharacterized protein n=1 Tax=Blattamonas nauphoetae TaxID=2049346 RepID=A0ABQ9X6Z0_9EUKA|nr:hypothetical protein BLNAU_18002 [Blattamonas nauphoetae]
MHVDKNSITPQIDNAKTEQTNLVDVFLSQICGEYKSLRPLMLNSLLVLVIESDWALSAILKVDYIKPLEEYCEQTQPCDVPMALKALSTHSQSDHSTSYFLRTHKVPCNSTGSSSELVPFAGRLCSTLAEHVSELKSLLTESSASDAPISGLSATLPSESPLLSGNTVLEILCEGLSLLNSLLSDMDYTFNNVCPIASHIVQILITHDFVPLLKTTIIACLDLLEQLKTESKSLHPVVESAFFDVPQLCSLLERTCHHPSPTDTSHLEMIINLASTLPHLVPRLLEENLVQRVIYTTKLMAVPTTNSYFHLYLIWTIKNLIRIPKEITKDEDELKRIRMLQFERVVKPAKQYLQCILQREDFIPEAKSRNYDLSMMIRLVLEQTLALERELFEDGEIVETGREEWEVGWLVEKTNEKDVKVRMKMIREDDEKMKKDEKSRWKKRVERLREAGYEDALEGWLTRSDWRTRQVIVDYVEPVGEESGLNNITSSLSTLSSSAPDHIFQLFADAHLNTINAHFDDAVNQIRIASDSSVNSHCLDFGRRSKDWSTFLGSVKTIIENKQIEPSVREKANSWLTVLVIHGSHSALTLLSLCLELTPKQVNALFFHTPPTLPALSSSLDTFEEMKQSDNTDDSEHKKETGDSKDGSPDCREDADVKTEESEPQHQSLCAAIAHLLGQGQLRGQPASFQHTSLSDVVQLMLANCATRTLFRITPNPVSFTFFSPEFRERDDLTERIWMKNTLPSTLSALVTLTHRFIHSISLPQQSEHKMETGDSKDDSPDNATRIVNSLIHLLPFLDIKTAVSLVGNFPSLIGRMPMEERSQAILALTAILTSESYRIHPQNFRKVRNCFNTIFMLSPFTIQSEVISHLSQALSFRLESSEGEDRWRYITQLTSLMPIDKTQRKMMLASAVNEDQALFIINTLSSDNTESDNFRKLVMKPADGPFHLLPRLFDIGAEAKTGKLGVALWRSLDEHRNKKLFSSICNHPYLRTPNKTFLNWILGRLDELASILKTRPEETFVLKSDDKEANALVIYASLLLDVLRWSSADLTQFIPVLSSFLLIRRMNVLLAVLPVLLEIEKKTASTSTPFSLSSFSIPFVPAFKPKPDIFSNSCPLLTIFAHQLLIFTLYNQLWRNRDRISVMNLPTETRLQLNQAGLNIACSVLDSLQKTEFGHLPQPIRVSGTIDTNVFPLVTPHDLCDAMELFFTVLPNSLDAEVLPLLAPHLSRLVVLFSCTSPDLIAQHQTLQFFTPLIRTITSLPSESQSHPAVSALLAKLAFVIPRFSNLSSIPIVSLLL